MKHSPFSQPELSNRAHGRSHPRSEAVAGESGDLLEELERTREQLEIQQHALEESTRQVDAAVRRYADLYDHLPIGYLTLTRTGQILQANATAAKWLGRERAALPGGYLTWFLDAFDAGRFAAHVEACLEEAREQSIEVTLRPGGGVLVSVTLTSRQAPPEDEHGDCVHTAITNLSKFTQLTAVADDLESEREAYTRAITQPGSLPPETVSRFVRTVLHDHDAELSPSLRHMLKRMEGAAVRMEHALRDLLAYCCPGEDTVVLDPVNLEEVVQHVLIAQRALIQSRCADVVVDRPLPCVRGARLLLEQVLAYVVTNMITRAGAAGPRVRIGAAVHADEVVLRIIDATGSSQAPLDERSFRAFEQQHDSFWRTGIGAAVITRTIQRLHGRVWVDAGIGEDTCVNIGLPSV